MTKKKKITYNKMMADTFHSMVYSKHSDHEQCASKNGKGLKQEFTESGFGWAMKCLQIRDTYLEKEGL
ncbi:hypothetical protein VPBG_00221 [Vibrio phage helene 12B3]|uniref:hypothetical protein n=1 Tax=Vibrio phage helene 12B3 TaxID=573173 RepID=UPI0002C0DF25|nr:hypothetical protein VPBG_00221 [Vibrio phage helene 12B3]YP_009223090.1 hypothetical protein VPLG_00241 [Vibrio phage eugene 12A10]AGG57993.1 hypothetical protein VPBG_00221 [Vibrio phage helene 12B3]AGN51680.1 hypothetical protein VPLG_00241 [Vibrio phage eugene 12A10]